MSFLFPRAILLLGSLSGFQDPTPAPAAPTQESASSAAAAKLDAVSQAGASQPAASQAALQIDPAVNRQRVESLYEGALVGARDAQDFNETPGYRRLLELVSRYTEEELHAHVERPFDFHSALASPDSWRGKIASVRGLVGDLSSVRLSDPLAGHVDVYRAIVTESDFSEAVVVDFLRDPPELDQQRDVVDFDGVFYRTLRYENRKGKMVDVPYLIARSLRRLDPAAEPRHTALDSTFGILIGVAVAFLVVRIVMTMRGKQPKSAGAERAARLLRERARLPLAPKSPPKSP